VIKVARVAPVAKAVTAIMGGLGVGAVGGFAASLLRRRPQTTYTSSLSAPPVDEDQDERHSRDDLEALSSSGLAR
jgi:hypothetical protein